MPQLKQTQLSKPLLTIAPLCHQIAQQVGKLLTRKYLVNQNQ